jgi:hypothetical protein
VTAWVDSVIFVVRIDAEKETFEVLSEAQSGGGGPTFFTMTDDGESLLTYHRSFRVGCLKAKLGCSFNLMLASLLSAAVAGSKSSRCLWYVTAWVDSVIFVVRIDAEKETFEVLSEAQSGVGCLKAKLGCSFNLMLASLLSAAVAGSKSSRCR